MFIDFRKGPEESIICRLLNCSFALHLVHFSLFSSVTIKRFLIFVMLKVVLMDLVGSENKTKRPSLPSNKVTKTTKGIRSVEITLNSKKNKDQGQRSTQILYTIQLDIICTNFLLKV